MFSEMTAFIITAVMKVIAALRYSKGLTMCVQGVTLIELFLFITNSSIDTFSNRKLRNVYSYCRFQRGCCIAAKMRCCCQLEKELR